MNIYIYIYYPVYVNLEGMYFTSGIVEKREKEWNGLLYRCRENEPLVVNKEEEEEKEAAADEQHHRWNGRVSAA